jgi:hypothetical protein
MLLFISIVEPMSACLAHRLNRACLSTQYRKNRPNAANPPPSGKIGKYTIAFLEEDQWLNVKLHESAHLPQKKCSCSERNTPLAPPALGCKKTSVSGSLLHERCVSSNYQTINKIPTYMQTVLAHAT